MAENTFLLPLDEYQQDLDIVKQAISQLATYSSKMLGKPYDECYNYLWKKLKNKELPFHNPETIYYERGDNGDREKKVGTWLGYLKSVKANREILVPTATTYVPIDVEESYIAKYITGKKDRRKKFKKISQQFESSGDIVKFKYYNSLQESAKRANNSVSGNFVANGSLIQNPTGHSTLTSIIRSITSLSNASNERLISGNRHYRSFTITLNNLISIVDQTDHEKIDLAINTYGLVYPTTDEVMEMVAKSTRKYWINQKQMEKLRQFVENITPTERASLMYTGDLYHIRKLNDSFMREFITRLSTPGDEVDRGDPSTIVKNADEGVMNYAHYHHISTLEGKGKEYDKLDPMDFRRLANSCLSIDKAVLDYKPFIEAFLLTRNSPCSIATILEQERETVVLSDTDSTMFSVDEWVYWYFGGYPFTDRGYAVAGSIMFIATQSIAHILAIFSANMNVARKHLFMLAMKPEYCFPVFAQTSVSKHYYAARKVREGDVYFDFKAEIKGVHMKDSTLPGELTEESSRMMEDVIATALTGQKLDLVRYIKETSQTEREIERSVKAGETTYLKRASVKPSESYKKGETESPYQWYTFWEECLAQTYGHIAPPPYSAVSVPITLLSPSKIAAWLDSLSDREISDRLRAYIVRTGKKRITSLILPMDYCRSHGIPPIFHNILNIDKVVLAMTKSHRHVLESMGFFPKYEVPVKDHGY